MVSKLSKCEKSQKYDNFEFFVVYYIEGKHGVEDFCKIWSFIRLKENAKSPI